MTDTLEHALAYAARRWRVVPIIPGQKRPPIDAWQTAATTDQQTIRQWWARWPDHGVGIATGTSSGLFVLDVDVDNGKHGDETLADLVHTHGPLPHTVEAITGSGGRHIYFAMPLLETIRNDAGKRLGPGLDIRGEGGQVVAPPTWHANGTAYQWEASCDPDHTELADPPPWLIDLLTVEPQPPGPRVTTPTKTGRPGDQWADQTDWHSLLTADGATYLSTRNPHAGGQPYEMWARPGVDHASGTLYYGGTDLLKVFSSEWRANGVLLEQEATYTKFGYWAATRHNGDHPAAAAALRAEGHGDPTDQDDWTTPVTAADSLTSLTTPGQTAQASAGQPAAIQRSMLLPDDFWQTRSSLQHIRTAAYARMVAPDAVLAALLAIVCSRTAHGIDIPAIVGRASTLNLLVALIAGTGGGKSAAVGVAEELIGPPPPGLDVPTLGNGSGEGLAEAFMGSVRNPNAGEPGEPKTLRQQVRYNAFVYVDEGDALLATGGRAGATILPTLRTVGTGGRLGEDNAAQERIRRIPRGMYRIGYVIGFQYHGAAALLDDANGGLPGRFIFAAATDPTIPRDSPPWPDQLTWRQPSADEIERHTTSSFRRELAYPDDVWTEVRDHQHGRNTGAVQVAALDGHAYLTRLKLAGLLAILDGRLAVNTEDWQLAHQWWNTSRAVRDSIAAWKRDDDARREQSVTARDARRGATTDAASRQRYIDESVRLIARHVHAAVEPISGSDLRQKLSEKRRLTYEEAIETAVEQKAISAVTTPQGVEKYVPFARGV